MLEAYVIAFAVSFVYIFLKATQQINVVGQRYKWILPVSMGMALCEASIVLLVVNTHWTVAIAVGLGGGLGAMSSMYTVGRKV